MHRRAFLTAIAIVPATAHQVWARIESPAEIVERLYIVSAGKDGKWTGPSAFLNPATRQTVFSQALMKAVRAADATNKKGEPAWLDFDPISNSQDPAVTGLKVAATSQSGGKATARATFLTGPGGRRVDVDYDFVMEGGAWRLDDIRTPGKDGWSIRKIARDAVPGAKR